MNGRRLDQFYACTPSNSYPSGGYTFPTAINTRYGTIGIRALDFVVMRATNTAGNGYSVSWDRQAGFLHIFQNGTEVTANTNLSTITLYLSLQGTR